MPESKIICGDILKRLAEFDADSFTACVTDPPYELGFMGKAWDSSGVAFRPDTWAAVYRVLKPGAFLLAFGGSRTYHRIACAIEDAGFEVRDCLYWLYGSGFPKSHDISKAIDKAAGAKREKVPAPTGLNNYSQMNDDGWAQKGSKNPMMDSDQPVTSTAKLWHGYGTALKPACEPIIVAMKPTVGTYAANALRHGVAGINIAATKIGTERRTNAAAGNKPGGNSLNMSAVGMPQDAAPRETVGRWPANVLLDEDAAAMLDEQSGRLKPGGARKNKTAPVNAVFNSGVGGAVSTIDRGDGGASRFFYVAKASKRERGEYNTHPTVKPLALMQYLLQLVTYPSGNLILDPFAGSGTTLKAAQSLNLDAVGIELDPAHVSIIERRLAA